MEFHLLYWLAVAGPMCRSARDPLAADWWPSDRWLAESGVFGVQSFISLFGGPFGFNSLGVQQMAVILFERSEWLCLRPLLP